MNSEQLRLEATGAKAADWKKWGPYLSERQWGTVREDYSDNGDAWNYFTHDHARSRAYRWGEDGLAGISDDKQRLCFALALWNGRDSILKERLFGLTNSESNHGEDVKEYYFYLDSTPTHSYMKYLYKYPQAAFPYDDLVQTSAKRTREEMEYELLDTGVFVDDRYFDVFVEYAKGSPDDVLVEIGICNRGPEPAELHVLPTVWFRNRWASQPRLNRPRLQWIAGDERFGVAHAQDDELGDRYFYCEGDAPLLFTENETNMQRIFGTPNEFPYVKDGVNDYVVHGKTGAVNPDRQGTKTSANYRVTVPPGERRTVRVRLTDIAPAAWGTAEVEAAEPFGAGFQRILLDRRAEADEFYAGVIPKTLSADEKNVMRQALASMLWSKQFYHYDVDRWLAERGASPLQADRKAAPRNDHWHHMYNGDIISMPDKWEYPWYAVWDLAFHVISLTLVDPDFGKQQLKLMLGERYMHPNGQIPAYEWNFGDVNPPVHAWSTIFTYRLDKALHDGEGDKDWLKSCFQKLLMNFTWWVNRKDRTGRNVFEGGFLGLDNIGVFDRSAPLPTGGYLEQADGTAWMALFCQNMLEIASELAMSDSDYADMALKFAQHFLWIGSSMSNLAGGAGMWDEEDGFYYDVLRRPDGRAERLKVRSLVGLLPLCAVTCFTGDLLAKYPELRERLKWFMESRPELCKGIHDPAKPGYGGRVLGAILDETKLRRVLTKMLDENEFLSPFGIRSLSRFHADNPYVMNVDGREYRVSYLPAESDTGMFGGNSNWRGPIWMPMNALIIRALIEYYCYYGPDFMIECPTGSGQFMNLYEVAEEIGRRLTSMFLKDEAGNRPAFGGSETFQTDPLWRDHVLFYEYFHGDNGAGLGASHQTGWTGGIARIMHLFAVLTPESVLKRGKKSYFVGPETQPAGAASGPR